MYTHTANENTSLAVWHITEPEHFFSKVVTAGKNITHPHKRLQHLCGRYLLQHLAPGFPMGDVVAEQYNKPFLPGHPYHFSISHADDYAAAIVSTRFSVGIDVESILPRVLKIRHKFLTPAEEEMLQTDGAAMDETSRLTLAWSAKESLFKWLNVAGIDFKTHLCLQHVENNFPGGLIVAKVSKREEQQLVIHYHFTAGIIITWVVF